MAVLMMAQQQNTDDNNKTQSEKLTFHDFLGMRCSSYFPSSLVPGEIKPSEASASIGGASSGGGHAPVSATSDLGSERLVGNHSEGVQLHDPKSDFSAPEISTRHGGTKRSTSGSDFMGLARDRMPQLGSDSHESSQLRKLIRSSTMVERSRPHDEELYFGMQPPRQTSNTVILQPPVGSRPDSVSSKWERALHMNAGPQAQQYPPRHGQFASYIDKISSNKYRDVNASPSVISQPAADEGSRTGIKGSSVLRGISVLERNTSKVVLGSGSKSGPQIADPESSLPPRKHGLTSGTRQMTIFYDGQAHVFDDVHPNKADMIMSLAGSNGGSWSTTYAPKSTGKTSIGETCLPSGENDLGLSNVSLPRHLFNKDGPSSPSSSRSLNLSSGGHQGSMTARETRTETQFAKSDTEGKREVRVLYDMRSLLLATFSVEGLDEVKKMNITHDGLSQRPLQKKNSTGKFIFSL